MKINCAINRLIKRKKVMRKCWCVLYIFEKNDEWYWNDGTPYKLCREDYYADDWCVVKLKQQKEIDESTKDDLR